VEEPNYIEKPEKYRIKKAISRYKSNFAKTNLIYSCSKIFASPLIYFLQYSMKGIKSMG